MLTLGRDGLDRIHRYDDNDDQGDDAKRRSNVAAAAGILQQAVQTWWGKKSKKSRKQQQQQQGDDDNDRVIDSGGGGGAYIHLGDAMSGGVGRPRAALHLKSENGGRDNKKKTKTREEALQQECTFFYRGLEDEAEPASNTTTTRQQQQPWRALVTPAEGDDGGARGSALMLSSLSFESVSLHPTRASTTASATYDAYQDPASSSWTLLTPPVLLHYQKRFQQLNQDCYNYQMPGDPDEPFSYHLQQLLDDHATALSHHGNHRRRHDVEASNSTNNHDLLLTDEESALPRDLLQQQQSHDDYHPYDDVMRMGVQPTTETAIHDGKHQVQRTMTTIATTTTQNTIEHSSLLYQLADGRLLMRLPRDSVRLVMDPDLQPGVISVEQWRNGAAASSQATMATKTMDRMETGEGFASMSLLQRQKQQQNDENDPHPPLRYILTVPDDLYRKIVSEMSYTLLKPYCGMTRCCSDDGQKVDIAVAATLLGLVMCLLFVNTIIWPTE